MGRYVLLPVMALHALGVLDEATTRLDAAQVNLGNIQFTALALIRGADRRLAPVLAGQLVQPPIRRLHQGAARPAPRHPRTGDQGQPRSPSSAQPSCF